MGAPMAMRLIAAGHELAVWNRTEARTEPLLREGAIAAATPAEAELGADAVITMLFDDAAYGEEEMFGPNGLLDALSPGALHIACGTIGVALSSGSPPSTPRRGSSMWPPRSLAGPTSPGRAASGSCCRGDAAVAAQPLLQPLSRGISVVGRSPARPTPSSWGQLPHQRHDPLPRRVFVYAAGQGIDPEAFLETVNSALFQSPFYAAYAEVMLHPPEQPGATVELGAKDLRLFREAAAGRTRASASPTPWPRSS